MAYFPMYTNLTGKRILILGGGTIALHKAKILLDFGGSVTAVSPEFCPELKCLDSICRIESGWNKSYLQETDILICASSSHTVNLEAAKAAKEMRIPVNVVDNAQASTFIFPALIHEDDLVISISTSGASPSAAQWLKKRIGELIPSRFGNMLSSLKTLRPAVLQRIPRESSRSRCFKELFELYMKEEHPDQESVDSLIGKWEKI
ncbi:MAG: bifunctional precorrin-2 dehydrogenase/sirohydrochlorin ferrochelatase [Erysipelotrichaceae bacterium]|nr:bifunctional precorrin-2 dehydrogenase/sirohydrochlorin ferrochelatase [Erysipelotrichaceae bacterium]